MILSVIIPTCNRKLELEKLLETLRSETQGIAKDSYEIIISFDGPEFEFEVKNDLALVVKKISGPQSGPASARNRGALNVSGELLVFLDDDCIAHNNLLKTYYEAYQSNSSSILEGRTSPLGERKSLAESAPINETGGMLWSCNFAIPKKIFDQLSGFNVSFKYPAMEDIEFRTRAEKAGIPIVFVDAASVFHPFKIRGSREYFEKHFESTLLFESLHPEKSLSAFNYWHMALHGLMFETLPGLFKYKGAGFFVALKVHYHTFLAGLRKFLKPGA